MIENENNENLYFQISQLQREGKSCGALKKQVEQQIWHKSEKKLSPDRPRWQIIDQDEGIIFAQKEMPNGSKRHMDIIEGYDDDKNIHYRDILLYEVGKETQTMMVRNSRKSTYESKTWLEETQKRETKRSKRQS